jgi:hypothetical protein
MTQYSRYSYNQGPDPIRVALKGLCGGKKPPAFVKGYQCGNLEDDQHSELVEWLLENAKVYWTTGIALVEAADKLVEEAVGNANIPPPEYWTEEKVSEWKEDKRKLRLARKKYLAKKAEKDAKRKPKARR